MRRCGGDGANVVTMQGLESWIDREGGGMWVWSRELRVQVVVVFRQSR